MERHIRMVTDAVICKLRGRQQPPPQVSSAPGTSGTTPP